MKKIAKRILLSIALLIVWNFLSQKVNPVFIPNPRSVVEDLVLMVKNGEIFIAVKYSFLRVTIAALLSAIVAIPVGLLAFNFRTIGDVISPIVNVMRYIPVTAFYPLLIMWFGIDETMKIAFLFIATFVYMMPSVILSLNEINQDLIDTGLTIGMSKLQTIYKIQLPASLPSILSSFAMMYAIGFSYIAVTETVNAKWGLGWIIQQSSSRGKTDMVFMAILVIMGISIIFDTVSNAAIRHIFSWKYIGEN